ncbi:hypothetical protein M413DRAFT_446623 [Hebeloma cylindrosporum]|uniref:DUF6533 domain-containing protein n=1 Tax=Hebeloma cylindrosporum TaxID=76867 RepID=A0A0C3C647_HEBCY|nr:hypothetical protein M413DRAFT_446623 [Hebeloma cylindrosporum h7]
MSDALSHIASVEQQQLVNKYVGVASFVILYYDYFLTLPLECSRYWSSPRITWASTFFYLNRYLSVLGHFPVIFQQFWISSDPDRISVCMRLTSFHQYLALVIQVIVGALLLMRTYALYNCRLAVLLGLCILSMAFISYAVWRVMSVQTFEYSVKDLPLTGCHLPISQHSSQALASVWTVMFSFDVLIFFMTLYKSLTCKRDGNSTILHVMLRDGTIYFGVMMVACVSVILSFRMFLPYERGLTTTLTNSLSSTMVSRLMLNIRDPKLSSSYRDERTTLGTLRTQPVFTSFIATSLGRDEWDLPSAHPCSDIPLENRIKDTTY